MAKSRRAEKQNVQREYEAFLQEKSKEDERLQREEDEFWAQKLEYEALKAEEAEKREQQLQMEAFDSDFFHCWPDPDPYFDEVYL